MIRVNRVGRDEYFFASAGPLGGRRIVSFLDCSSQLLEKT